MVVSFEAKNWLEAASAGLVLEALPGIATAVPFPEEFDVVVGAMRLELLGLIRGLVEMPVVALDL